MIFGLASIAAVVTTGLALWISASSGDKTAGLGASLVGGAVVGFALIIVEQALERSRHQQRRTEALQASATPTVGLHDEESPAVTSADAAKEPPNAS